jgi:hypothetical protein
MKVHVNVKPHLKRLLCFLSLGLLHWEGRRGGGMGDAIQCDICHCDRYGPGWIIKEHP